MTIDTFLQKLRTAPKTIAFSETIAAIEANYTFTPTAFQNGVQFNASGENSGSCKIFAFALLQNLSEAATLACFGAYYFSDVVNNPNGTDHQNIRNFIKTGWNGVRFEGQALETKTA